MKLGDSTIIVNSNCILAECKLLLALQMHQRIAAGELTMCTNQRSKVVTTRENSKEEPPAYSGECMIGIYGVWPREPFEINVKVSAVHNNIVLTSDRQSNFNTLITKYGD